MLATGSWGGDILYFCGSTGGWYCQWPVGEENSGIKGGYRYDIRNRWKLPPINWWRFFGLMVDETGYALFEFSDPPMKNQNKISSGERANPNLPPATHGFSRKVTTLSKGSWWGHDIQDGRGKRRSMPHLDGKQNKPDWQKVWTGHVLGRRYHGYHWAHTWGVVAPLNDNGIPYYIMDLTYYRLDDHVMTEEEMEALYEKGRSMDSDPN